MKNPFKDDWNILIILVGITFLFWVAFRGCKPGPDVKGYQQKIDSLSIVVEQNEILYTSKISKDSIKIDSLSKLLKFGERKIQDYDKKYNAISSRVQRLVKRADSLQRALNLNEYLDMCDTLLLEVQRLDSIAREYISMYNELLNNSQLSGEYKDSIIVNQKKMYNELKASYDALSSHATLINKDLKKSEKGRKFNKTLTRILSGIALMLTGALISK